MKLSILNSYLNELQNNVNTTKKAYHSAQEDNINAE
jgi:outer membrane murein-binding lipoprotein Lpp